MRRRSITRFFGWRGRAVRGRGRLPNRVHLRRGIRRRGHLPNVPRARAEDVQR